jgi:hypothetical protein
MRRSALLLIPILILGSLFATSPAMAHVSVDQTSLTIQGPGRRTVEVGDVITISGKLRGHPRCRPNQEIELLEGGTTVDTTFTDAQGNYTFTFVVTGPTALQTHFEGSRSGIHPHLHVCAASTSRVIRIRTGTGATATTDTVLRTLADVLSDVGGTVDSRIRVSP